MSAADQDTAPTRAWVDEADTAPQAGGDVPAFHKQSHTRPSWAVSDEVRAAREDAEGDHDGSDDGNDDPVGKATRVLSSSEVLARKRFRSEGMDQLLSRTEPLLASKHEAQQRASAAPKVLSVLPLPRDTGHAVTWHRNGQLAVVGGNHHVYAFHAAGRYVEQLTKVEVKIRPDKLCLTASGEEVLMAGQQCYAPRLLSLATEKVTPLAFLNTRDTALYRNDRRGNSKTDFYITKLAAKPNDPSRVVAVASGCCVKLGALGSGSIVANISVNDPVADMAFSGLHELTVASANKLSIFDIRFSARMLREVVDKGALGITCYAGAGSVATGAASVFALGTSSGIVNVYESSDTTAPKAALKNLTTSIDRVCFGQRSSGETVLAFSTRGQKAGFRVAVLPDCKVVPSFPAQGMRHEFIHTLATAPTVPILSVGERQKVTNYAL